MLPPWIKAFALLSAAHAAPWAAGRVLGQRLAAPLDAGMTLADGGRLLGDHKTWRGVLASVLTCAPAAALLHYPVRLGVAFSLLALAADAASSFIKRRLRLKPGAQLPGLDQIPEALLPLLVLARPLGISVREAGMLTFVFLVANVAVMPLRHPASPPTRPLK